MAKSLLGTTVPPGSSIDRAHLARYNWHSRSFDPNTSSRRTKHMLPNDRGTPGNNQFEQSISRQAKCKLVKIQSQSLAYAVQSTAMPSGIEKHSTMYGSRHILLPQCAFKSLMIHEVLRFALRITFCCVLHQCKNQDIHC